MFSFQPYQNETATMSSVTDQASNGKFSGAIKIGEEKIRSHVVEVVRESVEETLSGLLQAEADQLCGAQRYERSAHLDGHCRPRCALVC